MKSPSLKTVYVTVIIMLVTVFFTVPIGQTQSQTQDYTASFLLLSQPSNDKSATYELNITIPASLYQYYTKQSHTAFTQSDYAKYVTPYALKPIADRLWQIYNNTEDYVNGALEIVHQITYQEILPSRYPIETLVAGRGDCDLFVYIVASILEAGGIHAVLLLYEDQQHMQIGIDVGDQPKDARYPSYSVPYQNISYYIAECTGGAWRYGWRVGECPDKYQNVSIQVVPLDRMEQTSIGQVAANLRELDHSTLAMKVSRTMLLENNAITITGQIYPQSPNENVTIQAKINNNIWRTIGTITTESDGRFSYNWTPPVGGIVDVQASWSGNRQLNGANSAVNNVVVIPLFIVALVTATTVAIIIITLVFVKIQCKTPIVPPMQFPQTTPQKDNETQTELDS